ncbi:hypothetical protein LB504_011586 [Fusarium proliferatum]|nr:hypothetical protein LB504_011586 [Fusarium proliferatum]
MDQYSSAEFFCPGSASESFPRLGVSSPNLTFSTRDARIRTADNQISQNTTETILSVFCQDPKQNLQKRLQPQWDSRRGLKDTSADFIVFKMSGCDVDR